MSPWWINSTLRTTHLTNVFIHHYFLHGDKTRNMTKYEQSHQFKTLTIYFQKTESETNNPNSRAKSKEPTKVKNYFINNHKRQKKENQDMNVTLKGIMERPTAATRNRPLMLKKCNIESLAPRSSRPELTKSSIIIFECLLNNCDSRVSISHCPCVLETYARTAGMKILRRMWLRCYGALLGAVKNSVRRLVRIRDVENRVAFQVPVAHCTSLQRSVLAGFPNATLKFLLMTKGNVGLFPEKAKTGSSDAEWHYDLGCDLWTDRESHLLVSRWRMRLRWNRGAWTAEMVLNRAGWGHAQVVWCLQRLARKKRNWIFARVSLRAKCCRRFRSRTSLTSFCLAAFGKYANAESWIPTSSGVRISVGSSTTPLALLHHLDIAFSWMNGIISGSAGRARGCSLQSAVVVVHS